MASARHSEPSVSLRNVIGWTSVSVRNRPGARRGPAGGLSRAPDGTGRLAVVRPVLPKGRTAVFGWTAGDGASDLS